MAEEVKKSLLENFMAEGKITVFESGLDRPDYIQERPFFGLLPKGQTSFIDLGEKLNTLKVSSVDELAGSDSLTTESHEFLTKMEARFRTVTPGITLFIIDPDAVQGRYLMDQDPDRSLNKSLFMHIEEKLQKANAGEDKTFLTKDEILEMVAEASLTDRSPFSMAASVSPTYGALEGSHRVNLVVPDSPDAMQPNVLDMVVGADERMAKEGITPDEMRRLVLYHELGHATDVDYTGHSFKKITQNQLSDVMDRHRTECIADAHATLQLARDFGNTKTADFWGDMRIEYLRISVEGRLKDTKYDTDFMKKVRAGEDKSTTINANDPEFEAKYKEAMKNKEVSSLVEKMGSPLAYHTTDVVDQAVKYAHEHLADGSLQKMTDLEVLNEAKRLSETYGMTRQQMAEISLSLALGKKDHPKYVEMMDRCEVARDKMPIERSLIEKEYELRREFRGYKEAAKLAGALGLPAPEQKFSKDLVKKLTVEQRKNQNFQVQAQIRLAGYQDKIFDQLEDKGFSLEDMHTLISEQKEAVRKKGLAPKGKDKFAQHKLKLLDSVIDQAPSVQVSLNAGKLVKDKIARVRSTTEVSGDEAIVHLVKHELRALTSMQATLAKAILRSPEGLTVEEQIEALRSENKDFNKALCSEKETQIAAFAIRSDKETWAKVAVDPVLAALVDNKARQKPPAWFAQYQMTAGMPNKETSVMLLQAVIEEHQVVAQTVVENDQIAPVFKQADKRMFSSLAKYVSHLEKEEAKLSIVPVVNFAQVVQGKKARS